MLLNTICSAVTDVYFEDQKTVLLYISPLVVKKNYNNEHIFMLKVPIRVSGMLCSANKYGFTTIYLIQLHYLWLKCKYFSDSNRKHELPHILKYTARRNVYFLIIFYFCLLKACCTHNNYFSVKIVRSKMHNSMNVFLYCKFHPPSKFCHTSLILFSF